MAHHKRRRPRRQVRDALSTDARLGNSEADLPPRFVLEDPDPKIPSRFGPAHRRRKRAKPYVVEYRYVGPERPWHEWLGISREWKCWNSYARLDAAEQALAAFRRQPYARHYEYRLRPPPGPSSSS